MKNNVATFIMKSLTYQMVKEEYQRLGGLLQPLPIPKWKWGIIVDFIVSSPRSKHVHDMI